MKEGETKEVFAAFWLTHLTKIPLLKLKQWVEACGGMTAFYDEGWKRLKGLLPEEQIYIEKKIKDPEIYRNWERLKRGEFRFASLKDADYPQALRKLPDAPFGLYWKGKLPDPGRSCVAIVGARKSTIYGQEFAYGLARELGGSKVDVISGLAAGIDAAGHRGCMDGGGITYGVLGCGIDRIYPKENLSLYEKMSETGGVVSEYCPGTAPLSILFPRRNRIISALSDMVVVVEAKERSGSLITVDFALEQGKEIGAVPGRPCDPLSLGCNRLIRQGAKCILEAEDVLEELSGIITASEAVISPIKVKKDLGLAPKEKMVYSCLRLEPKFIDDILCQIDLPVWEGIQILAELEIKGIIKQNPHQYYYRCPES